MNVYIITERLETLGTSVKPLKLLIEPTDTILMVKQKIEMQHQLHPAPEDQQLKTLLSSSEPSVLSNEMTVQEVPNCMSGNDIRMTGDYFVAQGTDIHLFIRNTMDIQEKCRIIKNATPPPLAVVSRDVHVTEHLGPFRMCIASSVNGPMLCPCRGSCKLWFCYIGFCGYDRTRLRDEDDLSELGDLEGLNYPFCGGLNCSGSPVSPVLEVPCCVAAPLFPVIYPLFCAMSYCSSLSAPGICFPLYFCCGEGIEDFDDERLNGGGCYGKDVDKSLYFADQGMCCDSEFQAGSITSCFNCCGYSCGECRCED